MSQLTPMGKICTEYACFRYMQYQHFWIGLEQVCTG